MAVVEALVEQKLGSLSLPLALVLPGGRRIGPSDARVTARVKDYGSLAAVAAGHVGKVAEDYVEGRVELEGTMRDLMDVASRMMGDPTRTVQASAPIDWWRRAMHHAK